MRTTILIIISIIIISCNKDDNNTYNPFIGNWNIYDEILYEPSIYNHEGIINISIDTTNIKIDGITITEPNQQNHETFLNSEHLCSYTQNLFELSIDNLPDEAYKFICKSCNVDFTKITTLTLSAHGEQFATEKKLNDYDISILIRLSSDSDFNNNYFEIERPLKITENIETWPDNNFINYKINELKKLEEKRNEYIETADFDINNIYAFKNTDGNLLQTIKGEPDLSNIKYICLGIKNPGDNTSFNANDKLPKSIKVWIY